MALGQDPRARSRTITKRKIMDIGRRQGGHGKVMIEEFGYRKGSF